MLSILIIISFSISMICGIVAIMETNLLFSIWSGINALIWATGGGMLLAAKIQEILGGQNKDE